MRKIGRNFCSFEFKIVTFNIFKSITIFLLSQDGVLASPSALELTRVSFKLIYALVLNDYLHFNDNDLNN